MILQNHGYASISPLLGDKETQIFRELQFGDNEKLEKIAKHFNIDTAEIHVERTPDFWTEGYFKVFISHSDKDKKIAQELKDNLERHAISGFVAHSNIEPTKIWQDEIEAALKTCNGFVALISENSKERIWTNQEIGFAYAKNIYVIPVRMGADPSGFIGKVQAINFKGETLLAFDIFNLLLKNPRTAETISHSLMYKFERSTSFAEANENWQSLKEIPVWNDSLITRFYDTQTNNSQVRRANKVPNNIDWYIEKSKERFTMA